jgi:hypothetical protein
MATTRSKVVELSEHTPVQVIVFGMLSVICAIGLFTMVAVPTVESFFTAVLRSEVVRDGSSVSYRIAENREDEIVVTSTYTRWALVDPNELRLPAGSSPQLDATGKPKLRHAEYVFSPITAFAPLVIVGGFVLAALLTTVVGGAAGLVRQKLEREILTALDRLAMAQYGEHTQQEITSLAREIVSANLRSLHDLADRFAIPFSQLELLRNAIHWRDSNGALRLWRTHDAVKFYMREYFTDRYSNVILGLVYMGAAVLIIVIGIRGLKFLPATDPSVVLGALGLEFMLLVTYAVVLMYGRTDEDTSEHVRESGPVSATQLDSDTEHLLRAFLGVQRSSTSDGDRS